MPDRLYVFLDANILFSASYRPDSNFLEFWATPGIAAMTSLYAAEEVRRNCVDPMHQRRLEILLDQTILVSDPVHNLLPAGITLPAKDLPILSAAIDAGASYLITGDKNHFGPLLNHPIKTRHGNLIVMRPKPFLEQLKKLR